MKNLIIAATPYFSDRGCHIRIFLEAKYLQKKGVKNILCTYHLGRDVGDFEIERISNVSWYRKTSPGFAWGKIWLDFKLLLLCIQEIKKNRPDVIHAHLYEGLAIGWLAKYLTGNGDVPVILDLQGDLKNELSSYNGKNNSIVKNILVWISNKMINLANVTVVSSENALKLISKKFKSKKDLFVVKDGIDLNLFDKNIEKNLDKKIKKELDQIKRWKGSEKVLVYTGGMEEGKGVRELLEEFLKSRNKLNGWKLLLYGSGSKREFYQKMIEKEEAQDMVWFAEEVGFFALPFFLKFAEVESSKRSNNGIRVNSISEQYL